MTGKDIPLVTWYRFGPDKPLTTFKKPKYILKSASEVKAHQDRLGDMVDCYFGTKCEKCCGVYPKFCVEDDFSAQGYYVCLVCGKESIHCDMTHQCVEAWNNHRYKWSPEYRQLSIFDLQEG